MRQHVSGLHWGSVQGSRCAWQQVCRQQAQEQADEGKPCFPGPRARVGWSQLSESQVVALSCWPVSLPGLG